ncbi:hypothetical protein [Bradyrhizobium sp. BR 10289]|uniref:hypothetical protein n=1 Tax=Bradyrhizobium sp. BR 10289 TaxID=2749993 RepID=UPI001C64F181|nr:hypothetical protein [Bradyrhizobium sp. BR 10289]MBW7968114.1 hypothetical protein [Bradyrhizobium sp. BR 10289]
MRVSLVIDGDASGAKKAAQDASSAVKGLGTAANDAKAATAAAGAANDNLAKSHAGLSTQAMAAQHSIRSFAEAMASGQPLSMALGQQLNHLSFAASGPGGLSGAFKEASGALLGMISPTTAVIGGLVAVAAGAALTARAVINDAKALDDLARSTDQPISKLHALQQAMSFKGISSADFNSGITEFADKVFEAQRHAGTLNGLMLANGKSAKDFSGYLSTVADLVAHSTSDIQKQKILRDAGLPSDAAWVRFMEQGSAGIKAATDNTVKFNEAAELNLIRKAREFDDAWDTSTTRFKQNFKSAVLDGVSLFDTLQAKVRDFGNASFWTKLTNFTGSLGLNSDPKSLGITPVQSTFSDRFGTFDRPLSGNALPRALNDRAGVKDPETRDEVVARNQRTLQSIQLLGQLATVDDQVKAKELELQNARLNDIPITQRQQRAILDLVRAQAEMARIQQQASLGVFDLAKAQQAANDQIRAAIGAKLLDPTATKQMAAAQTALAKSLEDTADAARVAGAALPQFQQALNEAGSARKQLDSLAVEGMSVNRSFFTDIGQSLRSGNGWWSSFANAGLNALGRLSDKMIQMAADKLFLNAFGGSSSGGGLLGALGGLFGIGGTGTVENGGIVLGGPNGPGVFAAAGGGTFGPGWGIVGEEGPEIMKVHAGGVTVFPHQVSKPYLPGFARGGTLNTTGDVRALPAPSASGASASGLKVGIGVTFDSSGEFKAYVKDVSMQSASDTLGGYVGSQQFVDHVGDAATLARAQRKF